MSDKLSIAEILRASQILATVYLGLINGLFKALNSNPITRKQLALKTNCDERYILKWVDSALAQGLIFEDSLNVLRIENSYAELATIQDSKSSAQALQAVFSILVADAIALDFQTGHQQGYSLVNRFANLSPYYGNITESLYGRIFDEQVWPLMVMHCKAGELSILDYGCGSGWLLRRLNSISPGHTLVGAGSDSSHPADLNGLRYITISALADDQTTFDLIIVNKVLHHLGDGLRRTLHFLRSKLSPCGILVAWEFSWPASVGGLQKDDRVFLNLIEHAQQAAYLDDNQLALIFSSCGFDVQMVKICTGIEVLYVCRSTSTEK